MFTKRRQDKTESKNEDFEIKVINKKHQLFLQEAAEIALKSNMQQKHGAVIVYKNKIIASGYNEICDYMNNNFSIHAEVSAISKMFYNKKLLELCDIYVVRIASITFDNCLKNSKPCRNCTNFIKKYNLRNIYYSTSYKFDEMVLNI
jgi:deoxycytidylate deaminase